MQSSFNITNFLASALAEDIGAGDITSAATIPAGMQAQFHMRARQALVVCGLKFLPELCALVDPAIQVALKAKDGDALVAGTDLAELSGPARSLLAVERTALNLIQQLSGVATLTRQYVDAVAGTHAKIYDTRKTIPGMRHLQKYAVTCGGGENHRIGLYDAVLIKDNHIAVVGSARAAVEAARAYIVTPALRRGPSTTHKKMDPGVANANRDDKLLIIVECDTLAQVEEVIAAQPDVILLDNMSNDQLRVAVDLIKPHGILTEASGNVSLSTVRGIADTGVDRISIGKLTHSAVAVDIGLDEV